MLSPVSLVPTCATGTLQSVRGAEQQNKQFLLICVFIIYTYIYTYVFFYTHILLYTRTYIRYVHTHTETHMHTPKLTQQLISNRQLQLHGGARRLAAEQFEAGILPFCRGWITICLPCFKVPCFVFEGNGRRPPPYNGSSEHQLQIKSRDQPHKSSTKAISPAV